MLRQHVTGRTSRAERAIDGLRKPREEVLDGAYDVEAIDARGMGSSRMFDDGRGAE